MHGAKTGGTLTRRSSEPVMRRPPPWSNAAQYTAERCPRTVRWCLIRQQRRQSEPGLAQSCKQELRAGCIALGKVPGPELAGKLRGRQQCARRICCSAPAHLPQACLAREACACMRRPKPRRHPARLLVPQACASQVKTQTCRQISVKIKIAHSPAGAAGSMQALKSCMNGNRQGPVLESRLV